MVCPICKEKLEKITLCDNAVDYCLKCYGIWFDKDELRLIKDEKDEDLKWLDIDLWKDKAKFEISPSKKLCPVCRMPLYEVDYGDSGVRVDVCSLCHGTWLDRWEFRKIMHYLKNESSEELLNKYGENLLSEFWEVFTGPESLKSEIGDVMSLLKLFKYKFAAQYPEITKIISTLPK